MLRVIQRNRAVFLGILFSVFFSAHSAFAANPGAPISPGDNIQDPGSLSTPWGGCGPADSNCYVTVSGLVLADGSGTTANGSGGIDLGGTLEHNTTINIDTNIFKIQSANYGLSGLFSINDNGHIGIGDLGANGNNTFFTLDDDDQAISINATDFDISSENYSDGIIEIRDNGVGNLSMILGDVGGNGNNTQIYLDDSAQLIQYISQKNSFEGEEFFIKGGAYNTYGLFYVNTSLGDVIIGDGVPSGNGTFIQVADASKYISFAADLVYFQNSVGTVGLIDGSSTASTVFDFKGIRTGQTADGKVLSVTNDAAIFDLTGGSRSSYAGYFSSVSTTGGTDYAPNILTNIGLYASASGADNNYAAIFANGNVGIGDTSPNSLFTVGSGDLFQVDLNGRVGIGAGPTGSLLTLNQTGGTTINVGLGTTSGDYGQVTFQGNAANNQTLGWLTFNNNAPNGGVGATIDVLHEGGGAVDNKTYIMFSTDNGTSLDERIRISAAGRLGIGDSSPDYLLDVENTGTDGNIFALHDSDGECLYNPEAGSVTVSCSSDERLKTNIVDATSVLDYLDSFKIREYDVLASNDHMTGVIAQEVLQNHPELVTQNVDGMYSVQLPSQWKLVKGIQELNTKILSITSLTEGEGSFVGTLRAWLANAGNHITRIFTGEICLTDENGSSECLNKSQLGQLKQLLNNPASSEAVVPDEQPETPSENIDVIPAVENESNNETSQ